MKFLVINNELQKDSSGNLLTVPDDYTSGLLKYNGSLIKSGSSLVGVQAASGPSKGKIITMNLDGTDRSYRVLKNISGSTYEVMAMFEASSSVQFNSSSTTITFSNSITGQKYQDGTLDTYLNTTWYNTLSTIAKDAIVDKTITQDMWYYSASGDPDYTGTYGTSVPGTSSYTVSNANGTYDIGSRHVYALSIQDVIEYLSDSSVLVDTTAMLRNVNIWKMFFNTETQPSTITYPWLRSAFAGAGGSGGAWGVIGDNGSVFNFRADFGYAARPAFCIDLSKVSWS